MAFGFAHTLAGGVLQTQSRLDAIVSVGRPLILALFFMQMHNETDQTRF
jgi:hypothetical protein